MCNFGFAELDTFANIESDKDKLRVFLEADLGLVLNPPPEGRSLVSRIISAWEAAAIRGRRRNHEEAEQRISGLPWTLPKSTHLELRRAYNRVHNPLNKAGVSGDRLCGK